MAVAWCQPKSLLKGFGKLAHLSHVILRFYLSNGRSLFHVLHLVELVPDSPSGGCHWTSHFLERKQSSSRGSRAKIVRSTVALDYVAMKSARYCYISHGSVLGKSDLSTIFQIVAND